MSAEMDEADLQRMTLVEHLAELRSRLIKAIVAVALGGTVCWIFYPQLLEFLLEPYCQSLGEQGVSLVREGGSDCALYITDPLEGLAIRIRIAAYGGIALAMPVILWQLWRFVTPGLYAHEKRLAVPFVVSALVLFVAGAGLAYWTLPQALDFLSTIGGPDLQEIYSPTKYVNLIVFMMLAFGIGFEFPIVLIFMQMAGVLQTETLRKHRRYAIVAIFVLVAVITPSGDPFSLLALSIPMVFFYEASIIYGRLRNRRLARAGAADADS
jgi:sec-independent protein translocase protein TatC